MLRLWKLAIEYWPWNYNLVCFTFYFTWSVIEVLGILCLSLVEVWCHTMTVWHDWKSGILYAVCICRAKNNVITTNAYSTFVICLTYYFLRVTYYNWMKNAHPITKQKPNVIAHTAKSSCGHLLKPLSNHLVYQIKFVIASSKRLIYMKYFR